MKELTIEELIALAHAEGVEPKKIDKISKKAYNNDAVKFSQEKGLIRGDTAVAAYVIYYNYKKWKATGRPQSMVRFFKDFYKMFEKTRGNDGIYYKVGNPEVLNTSEAFTMEAYLDLRKEQANVQRKRLAKENRAKKIEEYLKTQSSSRSEE